MAHRNARVRVASKLLIIAIAAWGLCVSAPAAHAQCLTASEVAKFIEQPANAVANNNFGQVLAVSGDRAVVGVPRNGGRGEDAGIVYIYVRTGSDWVLQSSLRATDGVPGDRFGAAVDIDGDYVVVGAPEAEGSPGDITGAVYVFRYSSGSWTQQAKIIPASAEGAGKSVAIEGTTLVIGDPRYSLLPDRPNCGQVHIYQRSGQNWSSVQTLVFDPPRYRGNFGDNIALSGTTLAVLEPRYEGNDSRVYIYTRPASTWVVQAEVREGSNGNEFGRSLALAGDTLVVGAPRAFVSDHHHGAAYIFRRNGTEWSRLQQLTPPLLRSRFGASVSLLTATGDIFVGQPGTSTLEKGAVNRYRFVAGLWEQYGTITPAHQIEATYFGEAIATTPSADGHDLLIGEPHYSRPTSPFAGALHAVETTPTTWTETDFEVEPASQNDQMGVCVAVDGAYAVVGVPFEDNVQGRDAGAAHVYFYSSGSWSRVATLRPSDLAAGDRFGSAVAIAGSVIAVGTPRADGPGSADRGAVYTYFRSGGTPFTPGPWLFQQRIEAFDAAANDHFGASIALLGTRMLIGAPEDDHAGGADAGAAYLYELDSNLWGSVAKLIASDAAAGDQYGVSVDLSTVGTITSHPVALVGANGDDLTGGGSNAGSVYAYRRELVVSFPGDPGGPQWVEKQRLVASDAAAGDYFGLAIDASGGSVVIGSLFDDNASGTDAGAAYVFIANSTASSWSQQQKITPSDGAASDRFGSAVAISGNTAVIGSPLDDNFGGTDAGAAYLFTRSGSTWTQQQKFGTSDHADGDHFGTSIAISAPAIFIGAPADDNFGGLDAGAAYVFDYATVPPTIAQSPAPVTACLTGSAAFSTVASGAGPFTYQWRRNNTVMADVPGRFAGTASAVLVISAIVGGDTANYHCVVTNPCGSTPTSAAALTVCAADFNCVGGVTIDDLFLYINAYFTGTPAADFNGIGGVTIDDLFLYLNAYFTGC